MFLIRPRPPFPYHAIYYPEPERSEIEAEYRRLEAEWQKEADWILILNAVPVLCVALAGIALAIFCPGIIINAIQILAE